ncbi:MAG: deoxyribose-phosphate aldolase [Christensenellales bacterium]
MFFKKKVKNDFGLSIDEKHINVCLDFTNLEQSATKKDLEKFLCVAYKHKVYSVCVNPINVFFVKRYIEYKFKASIKVCTVIGFPLGDTTTETKVFEIKNAIKNGADEFDVVLPIGKIKEGDYLYVKQELIKLRKAAKHKILKVVVETPLLTKQELEKTSTLCAKCRADFIMTCSGYSGGGATPDDIATIRNAIKNKCGIKASGGIETKAQAIMLLRAGATRFGTSREIL